MRISSFVFSLIYCLGIQASLAHPEKTSPLKSHNPMLWDKLSEPKTVFSIWASQIQSFWTTSSGEPVADQNFNVHTNKQKKTWNKDIYITHRYT